MSDDKFSRFREQYKTFTYEDYHITKDDKYTTDYTIKICKNIINNKINNKLINTNNICYRLKNEHLI